MASEHNIEIPEIYLLILAAHGNMGDGEIPTSMKLWAQTECRRLGLDDKLRKFQDDNTRQILQRLKNIVGDDGMKTIGDSLRRMATQEGKGDGS